MMNRNHSLDRDVELLSAYVDGRLSPRERREIERRLAAEPGLKAEFEQLRQTIHLLRRTPTLKPPRRYTLDPALYSQPAPSNGLLRFARLATGLAAAAVAIAVIVFGIVSVANLTRFSSGAPAAPAAQPMAADQTTGPSAPKAPAPPAVPTGAAGIAQAPAPTMPKSGAAIENANPTAAPSLGGGAPATPTTGERGPGGPVSVATTAPAGSQSPTPAPGQPQATEPGVGQLRITSAISAITVETATENSLITIPQATAPDGTPVSIQGAYQALDGQDRSVTVCNLPSGNPVSCLQYPLDRDLGLGTTDIQVTGTWKSERVNATSFNDLGLDLPALEQASQTAVISQTAALKAIDWSLISLPRGQAAVRNFRLDPAAVSWTWQLVGIDPVLGLFLVRGLGPVVGVQTQPVNPTQKAPPARRAVVYTIGNLSNLRVNRIVVTIESHVANR